jgi:medium-chain acyl-[acyl-carrier-protein] hydrolase
VCGVELPGRASRIGERPFNRMRPLVVAATEALSAAFRSPFVFVGHSMGAMVAFEITRLLRDAGRPQPDLLIVGGCAAPHLRRRRTPTYNLPEGEMLRELRNLRGTAPEVLQNVELMQLLLPVLRCDFEIVDTYIYEEAELLDCPILAMGGCGDTEVPSADVDAWREQTKGIFSCAIVPGSHFFLINSPDLVIPAIWQRIRWLMPLDCGQQVSAMPPK